MLVAPNRDDAAVLICLTVRSLTPDVHLVAAAREEENIKLLYGAGANLVVAPSVSGGRLMGAAVRQQAVPRAVSGWVALVGLQHVRKILTDGVAILRPCGRALGVERAETGHGFAG